MITSAPVRRLPVRLAAFALVLGLAGAAAPAAGQETRRLAGDDRFATAAAVAQDAGADGVAVLASGTAFPDALAAAPIGAPVLLAVRDRLPSATRGALAALDVDEIVVAGGAAAISAATADAAADVAGAELTRVAGGDRFATAAAIAEQTHPEGAGTAYLASGAAFPDALSAGAAAGGDTGSGAAGGAPLLLAARDALPPATQQALARLDPDELIVVGGTAAVAEDVAAAAAEAAGAHLTRLSGADRFATAAEVAVRRAADTGRAWLATGTAFPDALAASAAAGRAGEPVLLTRADCRPAVSADALGALDVDEVVVVGGRAAVGDAAAQGRRCGITAETVVENLEVPWDVAWTGDGRAFVTERDAGRLRHVDPDRGAVATARTFDVDPQGEGGLLGLAAHPDGERLYAYYSSAAHGDNRVVRVDPDGGGEEVILAGIPHRGQPVHHGGRVAVGPDGHLYVSTGDAGDPDLAQDSGSLAGAVLRVTLDGEVPADNPIEGSPVYALGVRNTQGLAWDADGQLLATDFGPGCDDEINAIVAGGTYGWPDPCGETRDGATEPLIVRQPPEASWSGAAVPHDSAVPEWDGQLLVAALRGERLWRFRIGADGVPAAESLSGDYGRFRHVEQAPDGSLWLLTSNRDGRGDPAAGDDRIVRVGPPPSS